MKNLRIKITLMFISILGALEIQGQSLTISPGKMESLNGKIILKGNNDVTIFSSRNGGTIATPTSTPMGASLFSIQVTGEVSGVPTSPRAEINFTTTEAWVPTGTGVRMDFYTTPNSTLTPIRRMMINHDGKVAIGSHTPLARFHVRDGASGVLFNSNASAILERNGTNYIQLLSGNGSESGVMFGRPTAGSASGGVYYTSGRELYFKNNTNDGRMVISEAGNVGMGTLSPTAKLDVAGTFAVSGKTTFTATQNNYDLNGKSVIYVNGVNALLTGIAGGQDGQLLYIVVGGSTSLVLSNLNPSSTSGNRIFTGLSAGDITISNGGGASLIYDGTGQVWRVIGVKI